MIADEAGSAISSLILREDQGGVGPDADIAAKGHRIAIAAGHRPEIIARLVGESGAVAAPVSVETHPPQAGSGQPDSVGRIGAVREVEDHHHIVARPASIPSVEGDELVAVVDVMNVDLMSREPTRVVVPVAP